MIASTSGHSSVVELELRIGDLRVPLAQLAPDFAIPVEPVDLPAGEAEVLMTVDGELTRMPVFLREGGKHAWIDLWNAPEK